MNSATPEEIIEVVAKMKLTPSDDLLAMYHANKDSDPHLAQVLNTELVRRVLARSRNQA